MLGGADNPNGELPSYITGADTDTACGLQAEKTGRFSLHWRDNTRSDKMRHELNPKTWTVSVNRLFDTQSGILPG
ncbi:hypothetical protein FNJ77_10650 [Escherichia coli]|nr:hypothetical protein FNJ77_10650 [Escherichia coli]RRO55590.1 hypothetical protein AWF74_012235 [Escherichia coli]